MKEINTHNRGLQQGLGFICSLYMLGLAGSELVEPSSSYIPFLVDSAGFPLPLVYASFAIAYFLTGIFVSLGAVQPVLFFLLAALQATRGSGRLYGLGFAVVAAIILLRRGWFFRSAARKAILVALFGCAALVGPLLGSAAGRRALWPALVGAAVYVVVVAALARGRFCAALAPKKRVLRLSDFKLTAREHRVIKLRVSGMSVKEIAHEIGIAHSTVRNALSTSYKKLGLECGEELLAMGERYTVE
jgi:DNA-binding CsgD family transcriptional regulator